MYESKESIKITRVLEPEEMAQLVKCLSCLQGEELGSVPSLYRE